jgi:hypothetical protein
MRKMIKNVKRKSLSAFALLLVINTYGQLSQAYYGAIKLPQTASPSAAPFLSHTDISVSEFYGAVSTEIPLHTIQYGDVNMPVKIQYSSKGKNIYEIQSRMGLGFQLIAGGAITRKVRRLPDDNYNGLDHWDWVNKVPIDLSNQGVNNWRIVKGGSGFIHNIGVRDSMSNTFKLGTSNASNVASFTNMTPYTSYNQLTEPLNNKTVRDRSRWAILATYGHIDTEPDIFNYNFGSNSGSFYFNKFGNTIQESNVSGNLITFHTNTSVPTTNESYGQIIDFTIRTKDGLDYVFSEVEISTNRHFSKSYAGTPANGVDASTEPIESYPYKFPDEVPYISAWFLSAINRGGDNLVSYTYNNDNYTGITSLNYNRSIDTVNQTILGVSTSWSATKTTYSSKILSTITCPDVIISFSQDPTPTASAPATVFGKSYYEIIVKKYTGMKIFNHDNELLKQYKFTYGYNGYDAFLDSVIQISVIDNKTLAHRFTYHNTGLFTRVPAYFYADPFLRVTRGRDRWGFIKSSSSNVNNYYSYRDAVFEPDTTYSSTYGLMKEMFYPSGSKDSIIYEHNRYGLNNTAGPGKRVKSIFYRDSLKILSYRNFSYIKGKYSNGGAQSMTRSASARVYYDSDISEFSTFAPSVCGYDSVTSIFSDGSKIMKRFIPFYINWINPLNYNVIPVVYLFRQLTSLPPPTRSTATFLKDLVLPSYPDQSYLHGVPYDIIYYNASGEKIKSIIYNVQYDIKHPFNFFPIGSPTNSGIRYLKFANKGAIDNSTIGFLGHENYFSVIDYEWDFQMMAPKYEVSHIDYFCGNNPILDASLNQGNPARNRGAPLTVSSNPLLRNENPAPYSPDFCSNVFVYSGSTLKHDSLYKNVTYSAETRGPTKSSGGIGTTYSNLESYNYVYPQLDFNNAPPKHQFYNNFCNSFPFFDWSVANERYYKMDKPIAIEKFHNYKWVGVKMNQYVSNLNTNIPELKYSFFTTDSTLSTSKLDTLIEIMSYDRFGNPMSIRKKGSPIQSQIRNYSDVMMPAANTIVEGMNCNKDEVYMEYVNPIAQPIVGAPPKIFGVFGYTNYGGSAYPLSANRSYVVDYLGYIDGSWQYVKEDITGASMNLGFTINKTVTAYNFLRVYPKDAVVTTKYLHPIFGVLAEQDANGKLKIYEYDGFGRLNYIRDFKGNIVNEYKYKP